MRKYIVRTYPDGKSYDFSSKKEVMRHIKASRHIKTIGGDHYQNERYEIFIREGSLLYCIDEGAL